MLLFENARLEAQMARRRVVETGQVELVVSARFGGRFDVQVDVRLPAAHRAVLLQRRDRTAVRDGLHVVLVGVVRFKQRALLK